MKTDPAMLIEEGYKLHKELWRKAMEDMSITLRLTYPQYKVMVAMRDKPVQQYVAANFSGMDRATTANVFRILKRRGLVWERHSNGDQRERFWWPSEKGRKILALADEVNEKVTPEIGRWLNKAATSWLDQPRRSAASRKRPARDA